MNRERRTVLAMIRLYCRDHHQTRGSLCPSCAALWDYVQRRLDRCVFGEKKPTCAKCPAHCYAPDPRAQIKAVMRYAGPRMLLRHPLLALAHVLDGRRKAPALPRR
jgi:predicted amidophosphoribosyltransferase